MLIEIETIIMPTQTQLFYCCTAQMCFHSQTVCVFVCVRSYRAMSDPHLLFSLSFSNQKLCQWWIKCKNSSSCANALHTFSSSFPTNIGYFCWWLLLVTMKQLWVISGLIYKAGLRTTRGLSESLFTQSFGFIEKNDEKMCATLSTVWTWFIKIPYYERNIACSAKI